VELKENKFNLSTSSGEIVDQIKEVEGHQKKGKEEKQTKDHRRGTDHDIHRGV